LIKGFKIRRGRHEEVSRSRKANEEQKLEAGARKTKTKIIGNEVRNEREQYKVR